VFAGGDAASGPNTVVEALAAGKKAAAMIDRYLRGEELKQSYAVSLPSVYIEPAEIGEEELLNTERAKSPLLPVEQRKFSCAEVEMSLSVEEATREAGRCMRCDLQFTEREDGGAEPLPIGREAS